MDKNNLAILKADFKAQMDLIKTIYIRLTERAAGLQPDDLIRLEHRFSIHKLL